MKKFAKYIAVAVVALLPVMVMANDHQTIGGIGMVILNLLNIVLLIALALAFLYFVFGVMKYMTGKEADDKAKAREQMLYGIIGLFVIFSTWGLVRVLQNTMGIESGGPGGGLVYCDDYDGSCYAIDPTGPNQKALCQETSPGVFAFSGQCVP